VSETHDSWDGGFEDNIRCPHCGEEDEERCDYPTSLRYDGDTTECFCSSCDACFEVTICVEYSFATKPLFIGPKLNREHWYAVRAALRAEAAAVANMEE